MEMLKCPNCGTTYNKAFGVRYCERCNYPLKKIDDVNDADIKTKYNIENHVIGSVPDPTRPVVKCPYCNSENVNKISTTSRTVSTFLFGLGSKKIGKQWHCNKCGSDF